ncbi:MAG: hypothetical protein V9E83_00370 [Baekduia sp.]
MAGHLRTIAIGALLLALGLAAAVAAASASARPAGEHRAQASVVKAGTKKQARARARLSARRSAGKGHVPKALLGPRWTQIGGAEPAAGAPATTSPGPTWTVPATTTTTTTPTTPTTSFKALGVTTRDGALPWRISPSLSSMPAGSYSVQLQNLGEDPHDLKIQRKADSVIVASFPQTGPMSGGRPGLATLQVDLGRAGTYVLFCSLPGHWDSGMHTEVEVSG